MKNLVKHSILSLLLIVSLTSCQEEEPTANVSVNSVGSDFGGDVTGDGGSTVRSYEWNNSLTTAEFNMDITASKGGSFQLELIDAEGVTVLDRTLVKGQGDDSRSGVSSAGTAGTWRVLITLTNFNGDGSFSLSPGN